MEGMSRTLSSIASRSRGCPGPRGIKQSELGGLWALPELHPAPRASPAPVSPQDKAVPAHKCCKSSGKNRSQQQNQMDGWDRSARVPACPPLTYDLSHQPQRPSLKAVTAGTKARWLQQLVDAIGQATLKGQVPLHDAGILLPHCELTLQAEEGECMGSQVHHRPPLPEPLLPRLTGRAPLQEKEMGVPCIVRSGPRLGRSDAKA